MNIQRIRSLAGGSTELIKSNLSELNFEFAYGKYSIKELRKSIQDGFPVFITSENDSALIVGENDDSFIFQDVSGNLFHVSDNELVDNWSGSAVVVTGEKQLQENGTGPLIESNSIVIFAPERDNWLSDKYDEKVRAKNYIKKIDMAPDYMVPPHPVIVTFREPTQEDKKEATRAYVEGAEIYIVSNKDPLTQFLHELGHVYWFNRLTEIERKEVHSIYKDLIKTGAEIPAIFTEQYYLQTCEEMWATLYVWYLKSIIINAGYLKILQFQFPSGFNVINKIFERVRSDQQIENTWKIKENESLLFMNYLAGQDNLFKVGNRYIKANINVANPGVVRVPNSLNKTFLCEYQDRSFYLINSGLFKGRCIPVYRNNIDFNYIKKFPSRYNRVPQKYLVKAKNGLKYNRHKWKPVAEYMQLIDIPEARSFQKAAMQDDLLSGEKSLTVKTPWYKKIFNL